MTHKNIPRYFVYGEAQRQTEPGFVHVEKISARNHLHRGKVEAHSHPLISQLTCWFKGSGTYTIEADTWQFSCPALAWLPSGAVHGFDVTKQSDAIVLSIADDALPAYVPKTSGFTMLDGHAPEWHSLLEVLNLMQRHYDAAQQEVLRPLAAASLVLSKSLLGNRATAALEQSLSGRLKGLIDVHFRQPLKIGDYAVLLNCTYHLVDKAAHDGFGLSVKQLIMARRMLEARRLLKFTIRSAEDIGFELGFEDPAYFNRVFKNSTGISPIEWRKLKN